MAGQSESAPVSAHTMGVAPTIAVGAVLAATAGLLAPRYAVPVLVTLLAGLFVLVPSGEPAAALLPTCAFLIVALACAVVRERGARRKLRESFAAETAAEARAAVLAERARIAGDIHDVIAHSLSGMLIHLMAARALLEDERPDLPRMARMIDQAVSSARSAVHRGQAAVGTLRGAALDWDDLRRVVEDFMVTSGMRCTIDLPAELPPVPPATSLVIYYTVQEALTNAARHSAGGAEVAVDVTVDNGRVGVRIQDNGAATATNGARSPGTGQGLRGLRERAAGVGGDLVAGPTSTGFVVRLDVPVQGG